MPVVSARTLNILAALVWYGGGVVLTVKAASMLAEASELRPGGVWHWAAGAAGFVAGLLKARYLFSRACRKNLRRIASLERPRVWQFYRAWFLAILVVVSVTGATLSRMAHGNYTFLLVMAGLDLSIGIALLGSSFVFWRERAFSAGR